MDCEEWCLCKKAGRTIEHVASWILQSVKSYAIPFQIA